MGLGGNVALHRNERLLNRECGSIALWVYVLVIALTHRDTICRLIGDTFMLESLKPSQLISCEKY